MLQTTPSSTWPITSPLTLLMARGSAAVSMSAAASLTVQAATTRPLKTFTMKDLSQSYVQGLTLLGGEPFLNTQVCLKLVHRLRKEFGHTKDIWSWSGYTWEELQKESADKLELLHNIDILVDGRFILAQKDLTLQFRGSANQRIIDVPKSLDQGQVVIWDKLVH